MNQEPSGSFLPFKKNKTFLFVFGFTDGWWGRYLSGYTHVSLIEYIDDEFCIGIEPMIHGSQLIFRTIPIPQDFPGWKVLKVTVRATRRNRLIIPILQTCATIVQYHACISLGCVKAMSLYNRLMSKDIVWLESKGIRSVEEWV